MPDVEHLAEPESYALGVLEPEEMASAARHLAECSTCTREVERYARVAALLPYGLDDARATAAKVTPLRRMVKLSVWGMLTAACLAALIWSSMATIAAMHERTVIVAERTIVQMIATHPAMEKQLHPMLPAVANAHATLMVGHSGGMKTAVVVSQLPPAPPHMTYNLWYQSRGYGKPGPQLMALPDGTAICVVPYDVSQRYERVGIVLMGEGKHEMMFDAAL